MKQIDKEFKQGRCTGDARNKVKKGVHLIGKSKLEFSFFYQPYEGNGKTTASRSKLGILVSNMLFLISFCM